MTANQTIDGVPRERIERALCAVEQVGLQDKFIDYTFIRTVKYELHALLDADIPASVAEQPAPVVLVLPEFEPAFENWWEEDGQYYRAGGGSYEKTFAYRAYEAALADVTRLNPQ